MLGSVEWVNVPRAVLVIAADDEEDELHHVQVVGGNRVKLGENGRSFRIEAVTLPNLEEPVTRAVEVGVSGKDVEELLSSQLPARKKRVSSEALQAVILRELESGGKAREHIDGVCLDELGASPESVYKYGLDPLRKGRTVKVRKADFAGGWYWRLASPEVG